MAFHSKILTPIKRFSHFRWSSGGITTAKLRDCYATRLKGK